MATAISVQWKAANEAFDRFMACCENEATDGADLLAATRDLRRALSRLLAVRAYSAQDLDAKLAVLERMQGGMYAEDSTLCDYRVALLAEFDALRRSPWSEAAHLGQVSTLQHVRSQ
jgi:hypothetical protein